MSSLANIFAALLTDLRAVVAAGAARTPAHAALLVLAWSYLGRTAARLERLYTAWHAGTLAAPRTHQPSCHRVASRRRAPSGPRLPSGRAWLVRLLGHPSANLGSQLNHLLLRPDAAAFLQQVPRAARLLRPLCTALGQPDPWPNPLPTLPRKRPSRPRPPPPAAPKHGKYRPAEIRHYSPGRIAHSRPRPA